MTAFLHGAQVDVARALIGDLKAEDLGIEPARCRKIRDVQADMTEPDSVEIGVKIGKPVPASERSFLNSARRFATKARRAW